MTDTHSPTRRPAALSPSRVKELKQCPLKFRLRNIDRIGEPPSLEALRGILVHLVLERLYDKAPRERTEEIALSMIDECWKEIRESDKHETDIFDSDTQFHSWFTSVAPLVSTYFTLEAPQNLAPIGREEYVEAVLPSGLAVRGIIDRLDQSPHGDLRVVDYKTGKSPQPRYQGDYIFQMRFYATVLALSRDILPMRTQLLFLKDGRTLTYDPNENDVSATINELDDAWAEIETRLDNDSFIPRETPLCGWCALQHLCPAKGGTPPQMSEEGAQHLRTAVRSA